MSAAPQLEVHDARVPVATGFMELVAQLRKPSSTAPRSGVPAAARCHSSFVRRRLPDAAHACTAWNHDVQALGFVPVTDTAKTPGDGGTDPGTGAQLPLSGNVT